MTTNCNLRCRYCYAHGENYGLEGGILAREVNKKIVELGYQSILNEIRRYKTLHLATSAKNGYVDSAVVSFACDDNLKIYFGAYSDTLKGRNIANNNHVAITVGNFQIHGRAKIVEYGTKNYVEGRRVYDRVFPQFGRMFENQCNELYEVEPLIIWKYNPKFGAMHREIKVFDRKYYEKLEPYVEHRYKQR